MDDRTLWLEEYKMGVQLYMHEDDNRANRMSLYILAQAVPLTLFGVFRDIQAVVMALAAFGLCVSMIMAIVIERHTAYTRLRASQMRYLESLLGTLSTFSHEFKAFRMTTPQERTKERRHKSSGGLLSSVYEVYWNIRQIRFAVLSRLVAQPSPRSFKFPGSRAALSFNDLARFSSNEAEHRLPLLTSGIWVGVFVWAIVQIV